MTASRRDLLRGQFDLTWALFEYHLERLEPADFLWEPAPRCWTVRPDATGVWRPDRSEEEPDPVPVPTIGRLTWHIGWWWTTAAEHARGHVPRDRTQVIWPGDGPSAAGWPRGLRADWLTVLDGLTDAGLDAVAPFPWPRDAGRTVADMAGWVNAELMKNVAEIGRLRLVRAAREG
ncbi:DinB family protein [Streptomyces sp. NPDC093109]|uniref:DinB family protein n=1 Tax=Streptomyces sp. NPDC093109 TaxID=3154977 RepID=UPI00344FA17E